MLSGLPGQAEALQPARVGTALRVAAHVHKSTAPEEPQGPRTMEAQAGEGVVQLHKGHLVIRLQLEGSPDPLLQRLHLFIPGLRLWAGAINPSGSGPCSIC